MPIIKISELTNNGEAFLQTGPFGTQLKASEYVVEGVPVINVRNIGYGKVRDEKLEFIDEKKARDLNAHILRTGDIVFGRKGAVDRHALINMESEGWVQGSDCLRLRILSDRVCNQYISYYFSTAGHKEWMEAVCSFGATMGSLNQDIVKRINVPLPKIEVQEKIAAILSAYDDLIENNKRRIALLEKMAEEIYREWFLRMRFPGHENVKFKKGVPVDWSNVPIDMAFSFTGGGTPSKEVDRYWSEGTVNWYTPSDITSSAGIFLEESSEKCTEEGLAKSSARLFQPYSVMMTSRATIGAIGINSNQACTNQGFITCIPNEDYPLEFLYHWLKLSKPHFELLSGGATFAELTKTTFKRIKILTPSPALIMGFKKIVAPIFKQIEILLKISYGLSKTKDMFIPRLISGKLSVDNIDINLPPSMQLHEDKANA